MNMLECRLAEGGVAVGNTHIAFPGADRSAIRAGAKLAFGVRPEYVAITDAPAADAPPAVLVDLKSVGAFRVATLEIGGQRLKAKMRADVPIPLKQVFVRFANGRRLLYADERLVAVA